MQVMLPAEARGLPQLIPSCLEFDLEGLKMFNHWTKWISACPLHAYLIGISTKVQWPCVYRSHPPPPPKENKKLTALLPLSSWNRLSQLSLGGLPAKKMPKFATEFGENPRSLDPKLPAKKRLPRESLSEASALKKTLLPTWKILLYCFFFSCK